MKSQHSVVDKKWELPIVLTSLFFGALVVRCIAIFQTPVIAYDSILYIKAAKLYSIGAYHDAFLLCSFSIFPLLIAIPYKIVGDWVMTGQLVSTMCGALTVIPLYLLARRIFDGRVALFGTIFYIACPNLVQYSAEVLRDIPFIFFYVSALWLAYTGIKDEKGWYLVFSSIFITVSALLRREGILLLIIICLYLMWKVIRERVSWKKATILLISFLFSLICIFSLLGIFSKEIHRLSPLSYKGVERELRVSFAGSTIEKIEKEVDENNFSPYGKNFFQLTKRYRLLTYLAHIIYKSIKIFTIPIFLLLLFGLIKRKKMEYRGNEFLLLSIWGVFIIAFLFHLNNTNYFSTRYPFPAVVPSLIWSGVGFVELKERAILWIKARDFSLRDRAIRWVTPVLLLVICVPLLAMAWTPNRKNKLELKEIGVWLRDHGYAHSIVVGQYEFTRLAFYADGEFVELSKGSYQDTIRFAREKEGDLLVINKKTIDHLSPGFLDKISPGDLQRIDIPGIKVPKYATMVFFIKSEGKGK
jgi:hypothetical protein